MCKKAIVNKLQKFLSLVYNHKGMWYNSICARAFQSGVLWNGNDLEKFFIAVFLPIDSRLHPDLVDCEPFLPKPFRNSPVISTKFVNDSHARVPTNTENTIRLRPDKAVCNADRDRITFWQYLIIPSMPSVFERITSVSVVSLSDLCRITFSRIGTQSWQTRSNFTRRKIQIGLEADWERDYRNKFAWKWLNVDASWTISDCCRD